MLRLAVVVAGLAIAAIGCLPGPDEPIEYLEREDTVVVQMRRVPAGAEADLLTPEFTLYGDGTLIYRPIDNDGDLGPTLQTQLQGDAVRDVLEFAVDRGFLDIYYEQAVEVDAEAVPVVYETFLYVSTRGGTNSVRVVGLEAATEEPIATILEIVQHLRSLDPEAEGAPAPSDFVAEELILAVEPVESFDGEGEPMAWPFDIDLAAAEGGRLVILGDGPPLGSAVGFLNPAPFATTVEQDGMLYEVRMRPALPFEENFPQFDGP